MHPVNHAGISPIFFILFFLSDTAGFAPKKEIYSFSLSLRIKMIILMLCHLQIGCAYLITLGSVFKIEVMRILFVFFILCHPLCAMHRLTTEKPVLGVRTLHYLDQNRNRPIVVELWYPAERQGSIPSAALDDLWLHPREVRDAAMCKTKNTYHER